MQLLMDCNAEVDSADINGDTPLSKACDEGFTDAIQLLLAAKADLGALDPNDAGSASSRILRGALMARGGVGI